MLKYAAASPGANAMPGSFGSLLGRNLNRVYSCGIVLSHDGTQRARDVFGFKTLIPWEFDPQRSCRTSLVPMAFSPPRSRPPVRWLFWIAPRLLLFFLTLLFVPGY
ncbi:hypothetical protein PAPYR_11131 [Paratrimastix pyriformis]|uniref:Uncharacterized protein n=1 Tax=Paratrimastix pyriformis TaxID=342808 RepID=A0ABQ8U8N4_9EUKA|nr:hypothetical protein PAPYR_11131 [Paratrimastix pyriformis]